MLEHSASSSSIDKALDLLELLAHSDEPLSLATLSTELDMPKSSVHRLLQILCRRGYVGQDDTTRSYALGLRIFALHNLPAQHQRLVSVARPHLRRLAAKLGQTVNLAVLDPAQLGYWVHSETPTSFGTKVTSGERAPLHCAGLGKMLLAGLDQERRRSVVDRLVLVQKTPRTITDRRQLDEELERTAARGYAIDDEENTLGIRCVAAPILSAEGLVVAAVSITALAPAMEPEVMGGYIEEIVGAARELSAQLGYRVQPTSPANLSQVVAHIGATS